MAPWTEGRDSGDRVDLAFPDYPECTVVFMWSEHSFIMNDQVYMIIIFYKQIMMGGLFCGFSRRAGNWLSLVTRESGGRAVRESG